jgi:3-oxoadipate enol-lactonase
MPYAHLHDAELYYREIGAGEPLLLLMGLGGSQDGWGTPFLEALARNWRVLAMDHRGAGRSTRGAAPYSLAQLADDAATLLTAARAARAHVFGLSMGGMVAQELALRRPERVGGLVLASTNCGGRAAIWPSAAGRRRFLDGLEQTGSPLAPLLVTRAYASEHQAELQRRALRLLWSGTTPSVFREQARAIARFSTYDRLPQITAPALVLAGDSDELIPPANATVLQQRIPGAERTIAKNAGHVFTWEAPDRIAAEVTRFLLARAPRLRASAAAPA